MKQLISARSVLLRNGMKFWVGFASLGMLLATVAETFAGDCAYSVIVSVPDQKLVVVGNNAPLVEFPVSTSKYGIGDRHGSYTTPLGILEVAQKIGANAPLGAVFKGRHLTGEILLPNARGRDPIVTRILWLRGLESNNSNAYQRGIYIHGTPVERSVGTPASYGCIRMRSRDIVKLFDLVGVGTRIKVLNLPVGRALAQSSGEQHHLASL